MFLLFGHNFLGCGSYDPGIWQDVFSYVASTFLYLFEANIQAIDPSLFARKVSINKLLFHDYYCIIKRQE